MKSKTTRVGNELSLHIEALISKLYPQPDNETVAGVLCGLADCMVTIATCAYTKERAPEMISACVNRIIEKHNESNKKRTTGETGFGSPP
jgi:hypothetical protein